MAGFFKKFVKVFVCVTVFPSVVFGAVASGRSIGARSVSGNSDSVSSASIRRAATSVIARSALQNGRTSRTVVNARPLNSRTVSNRVVGTRFADSSENVGNVVSRTPMAKNQNAGMHSRAAVSSARSATGAKSENNVSRVNNKARLTAVFNDVSKIGGGYSSCRDSYATCMDQFCASANDTYRRCYCSNRFTDFRDTTEALDTALTMLADFQNTNLDAVDKSAAEVNAMYTASEGEAAIKRDTSASQKLLNNISDILSGKKSNYYKKSSYSNSSGSTGVLDVSSLFSFSGSDGDVFSGGGSVFDMSNGGGLFGSSGGYTNMSDMEGDELYNAAHRQCVAITKNECSGDAVFNLAQSAYSILITQDCNAFEKNINAKKESVQNTVRTAEKYLREARLEEYRAHNSQDVNECLNRVENAIRQPTACGPNYEKCLDYSGMYINQATGEPVYSKALFNLNNLIVLDGSADVLGKNSKFDTFLDGRKMFAETALDTCRNIADTVWYEFKRSALIQIAQAQDAKIQSVKDSCIQTISECYNTQTGALDVIGGEELAAKTAAISAIAAHEMCRDQVLACAALYGDPDGCNYDDGSKKITEVQGKKCGLDSLLALVNVTDSVRVAQGCESSLRDYAKELCGDDEENYPWGCRYRSKNDIKNMLTNRAKLVCGVDLVSGSASSSMTNTSGAVTMNSNDVAVGGVNPGTGANRSAKLNNVVVRGRAAKTSLNTNLVAGLISPTNVIDNIVNDIERDLVASLANACNSITTEGQLYWAKSEAVLEDDKDYIIVSPTWLKTVFGTNTDLSELKKTGFQGYKVKIDETGVTLNIPVTTKKSFGWGICMKPSDHQLCNAQTKISGIEPEYATWNSSSQTCDLSDKWYEVRCKEIGGYWSSDQCYIK